MAVPSYSHDLTDIDTGLAETTTGYVAYGGGGAGLGVGADFAMQGTNCVDKQITAAEKGILYNNGSGITMAAGDHTFIWQYTATAGVTDTLANRGVVINIGSGTTAFVKYHVEGLDTFGAGGRVARCYPVDQTVQTANTGSIPYRTLVGSPSGTLQYFGSGLNTTATVRSANMGLDAQRYGTGAYLTAGELISAGDASDDPCTFDAYSVQNDAIANRWGILTKIGAAYELQGKFVIGQDNTKTATLARFEVSDVNVSFVDTVHAASDFTKIIIDHASTVCNWTNVSFTALGTINKGAIEVTANNPTVAIVGGSWTDIGTTVLRSNTTVTGTTWRGTGSITLNQATLTDSLIDKSLATSAVITDDIGDITGGTFNSNGTGHAVELTVAGASTPAMEQITTVTSSTGTVTLPAPTTINDGDDLVVVLATDFSDTATNTYTAPAGWTSLTSHERLNSGAAGISTQAFIKKASGESGLDYDFLESASRSTVGFLYRVSGGNALTPVNASSYVSATTGEPQAGTMTTTVDNALILGIAVWDASKTYVSSPAGYTSDATIAGRGDAASKTLVSAGATGTALWDISSGTNWKAYHIAIGGNTGSISGTMSWDNTESGYAAIDGSTGNETIYVNVASGSLTINVVAGASTPTIRTAGATVSVVAGLKTLTIQAPNGSEVRIRQGSYTIQHTQNVTGGEVAYTYSFVAGTVVTISAGGAGLVRDTRLYLLKDANATITFDLENDPSYLA